ncbi:restriction endonuclease subunit S [Ligilactobacillus salivarius]|uniref:restriction endonuclease subunit S n=1 Tax=Ligilactobacillus salivarius TaxID=1624 RepID=UPI00195AA262|nr:restriction endonuclease subunit S [Ligilactobacillus salivarius]MBM6956599.1 restriction endonuclease subunit S [Ligilactobacillus salivarius]
MRYRVGELVDSISKKCDFKTDKIIFLNTGDIEDGKIVNNNCYKISDLPGQAKKKIKNGDILFSEIRPKNKRYALVENIDETNYVVSTKLMVLRNKDSKVLNMKYFYYFLTSPKMLRYLQSEAEARSGTFPQITFKDNIYPITINLPSLAEQNKIVKNIDSIVNKIKNNQKINTNLNSLLECVFNNYYHHKNDTVSTKLELISEVRSANRIFAKEYRNEGIPFLRGKEISLLSQGNSPTDTLFISIEKYKKLKNIPKAKDILVTSVGTIGNIYQVENFRLPFYYKDGNIIQITPHKGFENYIYLWLNSKFGDKEIVSATIGSTQKALTISAIKKFKLYILNNHELQRFNHIVNPLIKQIQQNHEENDFLQDLKSTLLKRYF